MSALHAGRELEVGDTNIVVTAVQENVGLTGRGAQRGGIVMRKLLRHTGHHHETKNRNKNVTGTHQDAGAVQTHDMHTRAVLSRFWAA